MKDIIIGALVATIVVVGFVGVILVATMEMLSDD